MRARSSSKRSGGAAGWRDVSVGPRAFPRCYSKLGIDWVVGVVLFAFAPGLRSQDSAALVAPPQAVRSCDGQRITTITIHPQGPPALGRPGTFRHLVGSVLMQHKTTKSRVVQSFLQLREGGVCTELRRAETERVLRAQPFLANATVTATPDGAGAVAIDVTSIDEISLVIGASFSDLHLTSLKFGNSNVLGTGQYVSTSWEQGDAYRDGFGARYVNYAAFSSPERLTLDALYKQGRVEDDQTLPGQGAGGVPPGDAQTPLGGGQVVAVEDPHPVARQEARAPPAQLRDQRLTPARHV